VKEPISRGPRRRGQAHQGRRCWGKDKRLTLIYVNNRLEGNALETIDEMLARATAMEQAEG